MAPPGRAGAGSPGRQVVVAKLAELEAVTNRLFDALDELYRG